MKEIDLKNLNITKAREAMLAGDYTCVELVQAFQKNINEKNPEINAFLGLYEGALINAAKFDALSPSEKKSLPLGGIPIAIKDNILVKGEIASSASKILENYKASYDATVIKKLREAGAIFLGRTNMDEFAMGGSTENSAYGVTKNPHDITRVSGGSSGGSAAVVAMNGALVALGSDTGGSVRQPASFCGVVGLKPTYGNVSRYGLMAMASSLDVVGPITKSVEDAEIVFNTIKGQDPLDSTSRAGEIVSVREKKVIGVPYNFLERGLNELVKKNFETGIEKLKTLGYEIKSIELPLLPQALPIYYIIMPAEVSSNLARFDGVRYGSRVEGDDLQITYKKTRGKLLGPEARRRIILGTYVLSSGYYDAYYGQATDAREALKQMFKKTFEEVDFIATPTAPTPAFKIGEKSKDPLQMYLEDIFTVGANLAGIPAISLPAGIAEVDGKSLPIGLQLMAPEFGENLLFEIGKKFEV